MVKHTQIIRRQIHDELLSVFDQFMGLALKGLIVKLQAYGFDDWCITITHIFMIKNTVCE